MHPTICSGLFLFKLVLGTAIYLTQMFCIHTTAFDNMSVLQHGHAVKRRTVNKSRCKDVEPELLRAHTAALQQDLSERARDFHGKMHSHAFRC